MRKVKIMACWPAFKSFFKFHREHITQAKYLYPPLQKFILVGLCSASIELVLQPEEEMYMTYLSLKNELLKHAFT